MERQKKSKRQLKPRKLPTQCLCCGEENPWVVNQVLFSVPFRSTSHNIRAEAHQCRHCDSVTTTSEQSAVIETKVRASHSKWLSEWLKDAQKQLGKLSLRDLAQQTQVPFATLGRISAGDHLIEASIEQFVCHQLKKLMEAHKEEQWLKMTPQFTGSDGTIVVSIRSVCSVAYDVILKTAAQSPLTSRPTDLEREDPCNDSTSELVLA